MQRYFAKEKIEKYFLLEDSDYHHIKNVMRMEISENVEIVYDKKLYLGCLESVKENVKISCIEELENYDSILPKVTLMIPLLKEQKFDLILQKATELGVATIVPYIAERSIIKVKEESINKKIERWNKICKEASEQSKRVSVPIIENVKKLDELQNYTGLNFTCSTREKNKNIKNMMKTQRDCDRINVVIGPEGGLTDKEELILEGFGYMPISLGNLIMRVETVPIYIMSILNYQYME